MVRLLVGIPAFKRPVQLDALLSDIAAQASRPCVDVLVVDNDPERSSETVVQRVNGELRIHYIQESRPGVVHVRNEILAFGQSYDCLLFLDDDQRLADGCIESLLRMHRRFPDSAIKGRILYRTEEPIRSRLVRDYYSQLSEPYTSTLLRTAGAANTLIPTVALERAGWPKFDPRFSSTGGEDTEYFCRLVADGLSIRACNAAAAYEIVSPIRSTASWIFWRSIRSGLIRALLLSDRHNRLFLLAMGMARLVAGVCRAPFIALQDRSFSHRSLGTALSGIGFILFSAGTTIHAYGSREVARR